MNKLTIEYLNSLVDNAEYVHQGLLTICTITLKNGFQLVGTSACVTKITTQELADISHSKTHLLSYGNWKATH